MSSTVATHRPPTVGAIATPMVALSGQNLQIAQLLLERGYITRSQLEVAVRKQRAYLQEGRNYTLIDVLLLDRFLGKDQLAELAREGGAGASESVMNLLLPYDVCRRLHVAPMRLEGTTIIVRSAGPLNISQRSQILRAAPQGTTDVRTVPATRQDIKTFLTRTGRGVAEFADLLEVASRSEVSGLMLRELLDSLMMDALDQRASDIHIDRQPDPSSWVSYRIDNNLRQMYLVPERLMASLISRLKTDANMDASLTTKAQDGRISIEYRGRMIDFRIATQPVFGGETVTLRVLDQYAMPSIETLFVGQPEMVKLFRETAHPHGKAGGLVLFSGPTGSGKTTTLYALTQLVPRDRINVITIEDPVEYSLPFSRQIQINQLTSQRAVDVERSILRQDPDVLVLGEIRDEDTAIAALKFAESGHLVFATIHAVSAPQTLARLMSFMPSEMKREALFIVGHYLRLVINQRLIGKLCECAVPVTDEERALLATPGRSGYAPTADILAGAYKAVGCDLCRLSGYRGRVAVQETLYIPNNDELRLKVTRSIFESESNLMTLGQFDGVQWKRRQHALDAMIGSGVIDVQTAHNILGG